MPQQSDSPASSVFGGLGCLVMIVVSIAQLLGCFSLLEDHWGWPWYASIPVMVLLIMLNAGIIVSIGCFFGALLVWEWPWWGALLISAPGLVFFGISMLGIAGASAGSQVLSILRTSSQQQEQSR